MHHRKLNSEFRTALYSIKNDACALDDATQTSTKISSGKRTYLDISGQEDAKKMKAMKSEIDQLKKGMNDMNSEFEKLKDAIKDL